jgi:hypothetical protein
VDATGEGAIDRKEAIVILLPHDDEAQESR